MTELQAALKVALANVFIMYFKSHSYHWNGEGISFPQYHAFFGAMYEEVYGSIDPLAEHIRALGAYAPFSIADVLSSCTIDEDSSRLTDIRGMLLSLQTANNQVIASLNKVSSLAQADQGMMNFIADRLDVHAKHAWQLAASLS